ncbi:VOC family protein [Nannocystaceae bacterium ST9]
MLSYRDPGAAIDFLCRSYGFTELYRMNMPDGSFGHGELELGDQLLAIGGEWEPVGICSPLALAGVHSQLLCYVDDVDAHHARARTAGATIVSEPADQPHGDRSYRTNDPEGHHWIFATRLREMTPDEVIAAWGATKG